MRLRIKSLKYLVLFALVLIPAQVLALRTNPVAIEAGDTGNILIPFENMEGGISSIDNVRLMVTNAPAWVEISTIASFMGPIDIYPGEAVTFNVSYEVNSLYNPASPSGNIILNLLSDSTSFVPYGITWSFITDNGFKTMRTECVENDGVSCGNYLSPDKLAPKTYLQFDGPSYETDNGDIFLATNTSVNFIGSDAYESNSEISRAAITGYAIGTPPTSFDGLNFSTNPVLVSAGQNFLYYASRDYAGNTEIVKSTSVSVDGTAPVSEMQIYGSSTTDAQGNLVISTDHYISFMGLDPESNGIASGLQSIMVSLDNAAFTPFYSTFTLTEGFHRISYYGVDNVENTGEVHVLGAFVRLAPDVPSDVSAPVSTASVSGELGLNGWFISPTQIILDSTDTLSGVNSLAYRIEGPGCDNASVIYTSSFTLQQEGVFNIYFNATDKVGNTEPVNQLTIKIDLSTPVVTTLGEPSANQYGWNASTVNVVFSGTDTVSGIAYCSPAEVVAGEVLMRLVSGYCSDYAGHSSTVAYMVNIDTTAPTILISSPTAGTQYTGSAVIATVFGVSDSLSLVQSSAAWLRQTVDNGSPRGTLPDLIPVVSGQNILASDIDDGIWTFIVAATDYAGNYAEAASGAFTVVHDTVSPITSIVFSSATSVDADGRYLLPEGATVAFTVNDSSAVTWYSLDNATAAVFVNAFTLGIGTHFITYWSADTIGNIETAKTALVMVEKIAPVVKLNLEPDTLNLTSKGEDITAKLKLERGNLCFVRDSIRINAINGRELPKPIYAEREHGRKDDDKDHGHDDKEHHNDNTQCGSITVKFDREDVIAVMPVNAMVKVTVYGKFTTGQSFTADDTIKTIKPRRTTRRDGGRFEHNKRACADAPPMAFKEDNDLYVLSVEGDTDEREFRKDSAAKARGIARRGLAFEFGPDGAIFDKPVTISLPYDADEKSPEKLAIAYWNETMGVWETLPSRRDVSGRLVKADVGHFSQYQVISASFAVSSVEVIKKIRVSGTDDFTVSSADPEFRLGEVYVFPNPAKGGAKPVFHIETGIADSVKLSIYTLSGREAHTHIIAGVPSVLDDGNGLSYAYEYTWDGHIPSGVYYFIMEAEKSGRKLKKTGQFAVIR